MFVYCQSYWFSSHWSRPSSNSLCFAYDSLLFCRGVEGRRTDTTTITGHCPHYDHWHLFYQPDFFTSFAPIGPPPWFAYPIRLAPIIGGCVYLLMWFYNFMLNARVTSGTLGDTVLARLQTSIHGLHPCWLL